MNAHIIIPDDTALWATFFAVLGLRLGWWVACKIADALDELWKLLFGEGDT
jgi:hypothetical protein